MRRILTPGAPPAPPEVLRPLAREVWPDAVDVNEVIFDREAHTAVYLPDGTHETGAELDAWATRLAAVDYQPPADVPDGG